jgi:multiple sugar transport system permease protein
LWTVLASFKPYNEIVSGEMKLFSSYTLENYIHIFTADKNFNKWVINSFMVAIFGTIINIMLNSMAGYSLARLEYPGRQKIFYIVLALIMVPGQVLLIPNFLIISKLNLLNNLFSVILPTAANASHIFMMRQFFLNFPKEIEEAAELDGLNRLQIFLLIALPVSLPAISTQAIFAFLGMWNNFQLPMLYLKEPSKYTLTLGLQTFQTMYATQWNYTMAASVVSIIPIIILYAFLNKYFMQGVKIGGDK